MDKWLTLIGLVLDAVGVTLLTIDVLPEYLASRRLRMVRLLKEGVSRLSDGDTSHMPRPDTEDNLLALSEEVIARVQASNSERDNLTRFSVPTARATLSQAAFSAGLQGDPEIRAVCRRGPFDKAAFLAALRRVNRRLNDRYRDVQYRRRPSMGWAIFFIVVGFVLQALGTIPDNFGGDIRSLLTPG